MSSSFITQFSRRPRPLRPHQRSQIAIERRLVLPLDTHHWIRALEVLNAGYAKEGVKAEHYQRVFRDMVVNASPHRFHDLSRVLDAVRDRMYERSVPANVSLWITVIWSYCQFRMPREAMDSVVQLSNRHHLSDATKSQIANLLLPLLSQHGMVADVEAATELLIPEALRGSMDIQKWITMSRIRAGDWEAALNVGRHSLPEKKDHTHR